MSARKTFTVEDIARAREILADYEETMPIDLAVEVVTRAAVIRELKFLLHAYGNNMRGRATNWISQRIETLSNQSAGGTE